MKFMSERERERDKDIYISSLATDKKPRLQNQKDTEQSAFIKSEEERLFEYKERDGKGMGELPISLSIPLATGPPPPSFAGLHFKRNEGSVACQIVQE